MALTVDAAFNQFHDAINLSGDHRSDANIRKDHLIQLLGNKFHIIDAFSTGSIPKFTALREHADVDIMLVLHYGKHVANKLPSEVLKSVRDSIATKTTVRRNGQAVTLYYSTWPNVDIVPVYYSFERTSDGRENITHYNVPDMNTETWIMSRPKIHAADIEAKSTECGANFRRIIKLMKWWNRTHGNYLQSYHIEVLALKVFDGSLNDMPWSVFQFFEKSHVLLQSAMWHDLGIVDSYLNYSDRQEVLKRFGSAIDKARTAWYSDCILNAQGNVKSAIECWQQIFGDKFPSYG